MRAFTKYVEVSICVFSREFVERSTEDIKIKTNENKNY